MAALFVDTVSGIEVDIRRIHAAGIEALKALSEPSEADTQDQLIAPVLEALGYPWRNTRRQVADGGNYPDRIVWPVSVVEAERRGLSAQFIIEEKPLGTDFEKPRASRADTPSRQIRRYLEQHRLADDATLGILTDGRVWRLYERNTDLRDGTVSARRVAEYTLGDDLAEGSDVEAFVRRLSAGSFVPRARIPARFPRARTFLRETVSAIHRRQPRVILGALAGGEVDVVDAALPSTGLIADAHRHDWEPEFVSALGPEYKLPETAAEQPLPDVGPRIRMAAVAFSPRNGEDGQRLRKGDVGLCARGFGRDGGPLILCTWTGGRSSGVDAASGRQRGPGMRLALHVDGRTAMTPEFDPDMPPASVLATIDKVVELLHGPKAARTVKGLQAAFDIRPLQRDFYARIETWLRGRMKRKAGGAHDMAMVRHLIRVLFAWILKEHGFIPRSLFDRDFIRQAFGTPMEGSCYHDEVLSALFHDALNRPANERSQYPVAGIDMLLDETPFLNGSIFAPHPDDGEVALPDSAYWNDDREEPGLFNILAAFEWTLDEHSAHTNDQALDPELLGALFERLVSLVDHTRPRPRRKPQGTYYTPRDVVAEMVSDALVARLLREEEFPLSEGAYTDRLTFSD